MTNLQPRDYQVSGIEAVERAWGEGLTTPAVVWATGLGKTVLFAHLARRFHERDAQPGDQFLVLADRTELVDQAAAKLRDVVPDLPIGIVMGDRNQTLAPVVVASPQTLKHENRRRQLLRVRRFVCDEAHLWAAPTYLEVIRYFLAQGALGLGVTATMSRADQRSLGAVWQRVVHVRDIAFGIDEGHLVKPEGKRIKVDDLDLRTVRRTGGDYEAAALGEATTSSLAPKRIVEAYTEHTPGETGVAFLPSVASAEVVRDEFRAAGYTCETVSYRTPKSERKAILADLAGGGLQVVTNSTLLSTGFDCPRVTVGIMPPTQSETLWIQRVGRTLRPFPGKVRAMILDWGGSSATHSLQAQIDLFGAGYDDDDERPGREPCDHGVSEWEECTCPRERCGPGCFCAPMCNCIWPETLIAEDELYADGRLVVEDVDLFHGSRQQWLMTAGGTHFLWLGERVIAIVPGEARGTWDVVWMHPSMSGMSGFVQRGLPDIGAAQGWAERAVTPAEKRLSARDRGWRDQKPDKATIRHALQLGVRTAGQSAGQLGNAITTARASARIDHVVQQLIERQS